MRRGWSIFKGCVFQICLLELSSGNPTACEPLLVTPGWVHIPSLPSGDKITFHNPARRIRGKNWSRMEGRV